MTAPLIFLLVLLAIVVAMNWRLLASWFGRPASPCAWSRIHTRDREGQKAWFCPVCGREELVEGSGKPPDCGGEFLRD